MKRVMALVLLSFLVVTPTALGQAPSVEQPTWTSGEEWTLRYLPLGWAVRFTNQGGCDRDRGCALMVAQSGQVVQTMPDIINFAPDYKNNTYLSVFDWPLVQGKTWTHVGKATGFTFLQGGKDTTSESWQTVFTVVAFERVRVLAGPFDAVRIEAKQCNEKQQDVCREFTVWYAPRAKYFVKIEYSGSNNWPSPPRGGRWELLSATIHEAH